MSTELTKRFGDNSSKQTTEYVEGACLLCRSRSGTLVYQESGFAGRLCQCGSVFIDPLPPVSLIDPKLDLHLETYYSMPAKLRIDWVEKHASGKRFLDVGAGNGATVAEAHARGFDVSAIEPNADCAAKLVTAFGIPVQQATIEKAALPTSGYDVVFHIDLLSHFRDPVFVLKKMGDMLNPTSGVLCFEVGLFGGLNKNWYRYAGRPGFPHHLWFFSLGNIEKLLDKAGLEMVDSRRFNVTLSTTLSSLLLKCAPSRLRLKPAGESLQAAKPSTLWRLYHYLHFLMRYRIGALIPVFGPSTAFIAAAPKNRRERSAGV